MKTIKLKDKQLEIFTRYEQEKQLLQQKFNELVAKQNDFVIAVFESAGEEVVEGIQFVDGSFVIPEKPVKEEKPKKATKK